MTEKSTNEFYNQRRNKDNKDTRCKSCVSKYLKTHYTKDVDKIKQRNLKIRYNLSLEQYNSIIAEGCFICGSHDRLCIDHDHNCCPDSRTCGECIRGVLCWNHNLGEAKFKSIQEIEKLLEYRKRYE